jgi:hypothetical protein
MERQEVGVVFAMSLPVNVPDKRAALLLKRTASAVSNPF